MIAFISGDIQKKTSSNVIIVSGGIGYEINVHERDLEILEEKSPAQLWVVTVMNESSIRLFGFLDDSERELFLLLTSVSGIGPKTALSILGSATSDIIQNAIIEGDESAFKKISGIGPKSAQRLVIELSDKVGSLTKPKLLHRKSHEADLVISALSGLGYTKPEMDRILPLIDKNLSTEEKIALFIKLNGQQ
ncbi:Holliday junction branch migration protein RuvA [candidate division WWE3 bacterium]|nr:Holliday junction branch migration protein RuvA [candidate division WWE3 bacterium]